jgi:4-amino-4-deoxy-L-arabinose transferase-like glycosyltransferase
MPIRRTFDEPPPAKTRQAPTRALAAPALLIFVAALALRWAYALAMYALLGDDGLEGVDSITYAAQAQQFADAIRGGLIHGSHWLGEASYTAMPLYQWFTAVSYLLFGGHGAIGNVLLQGALDSGTCVFVYSIARSLDERLGLPSAIAAILNPTQIVLSGLIYTDTFFTFLVASAFYAAVRCSQNSTWTNGALLGFALGGATLIRVSIAPWAFCAIGLLVASSVWQSKPLRQLAGLTITTVLVCLSLAAIAIRNHAQYGTFALTSQGGDYLAIWIVPLAKEMQDRTPFMVTAEQMVERTKQRFGPPSPDSFEQSRRYQQIGWKALRNDIRLSALAKSWASGIFINLTSPALLLSPPVSRLPRTGFYGTPGGSFAEKVFNYAFRSGNATYGWLLILGTIGLAAIRSLQAIGLWALIIERRHWPKLVFAASWIAFLLLLNGPIASPKYRLPLEPLFNILTGAGIVSICAWRKRSTTSEEPVTQGS